MAVSSHHQCLLAQKCIPKLLSVRLVVMKLLEESLYQCGTSHEKSLSCPVRDDYTAIILRFLR